MRVAVTGGRDYSNQESVFATLDRFHEQNGITELAHGGASGADRLAADWAESRGIPVRQFDANWAKYGRRAGPIRNREMLETFQPDMIIAFPGGKGTADCCLTAYHLGITTHCVEL